jgi:comEA protein
MERSKKRGAVVWLRAVLVLLAAALVTAPDASGEQARIDLNSASAAELESLPGVGPSKAQAIIAHREVAPFKSADELVEVKGIGEKLYAQLKEHVTVSAAPAKGRAAGPGEPASGGGADAKSARSGATAAR